MAQQLELFNIPNPCCGICQADERGFCRGCFRKREERFGWTTLNDTEKREVLRLCWQRALRSQRVNQKPNLPVSEQPWLF